ncbi:UNVERIFIED_CONTAM: Phosphatidylinositol 4-kinase alpha 1 [Sesamum radiatum]|uniref:Phosphatidylinositol 4-kinase alpha 1 n=1 Tax=Sesamum radiatum TaxID=300843 RepID=A0AAW2U717_SESRA
MDSLVELCDLVAENPTQFAGKIAWLCSRCPPAELLFVGSPRVSRSQLNAVLAVSRFLSKCSNTELETARSAILAFYRSIPSSFNVNFWPHSFSGDAISSFYKDLMRYITEAAQVSPTFASDVAGFTGDVVMQTIRNGDSSISKIFLSAVCLNFPPILPADANKLIALLVDGLDVTIPSSPRDTMLTTPTGASAQSSPLSVNHCQSPVVGGSTDLGEAPSPAAFGVDTPFSGGAKGSGDSFGGTNDGSGAPGGIKKAVLSFEGESVESLQRLETVLQLIRLVLDKADIDPKILEQVRGIAKGQLQSMLAFLKIRKRDFTEQGQSLKVRVNRKLSVYQAAAKLHIKTLASLDTEGKSSKRLLHGALALLIEASEACLFSVWRKLRATEDLFRCLLAGISQAAVARNGQLLRILLIRYKPLVLATCAQDGKEKQETPPLHLNVIYLLAELNVSVTKPEMVDMILPLFIESLEEGDGSNAGSLRLRLLDAVSRMASLGFEKSYREAVVLMTRSYIAKLSNGGTAESKTEASEATAERVEILPAGFLLIARGITNSKMRSDYRHRLMSLCSDVGLAASGRSGAEFLGPLLPAVAEICSDFDPTLDVEPSLLKLFRNLWFYIALFGLAPPIQKTQAATKSAPPATNTVGNTSTVALQAVAGPYMWDSSWSSAVRRISLGTPPLVVSSVKWLEDELELNALHNPGSRQGSEKAGASQRTALSAALGGKVDVSAMNTISGVKATYLLAVAFLEIIRFSSDGGILNGDPSLTASRSGFLCAYVEAKEQFLTAIVNQTAIEWLDDRASQTGEEAEVRESTLSTHACFLIKNLSQRDEHVRDISVSLLTQLRDRFPQILWNSSCLDSLLLSIHNDPPSAVVSDPAYVASVRSLYQKIAREWIIVSLSYAPCTSQGLLQVYSLLDPAYIAKHFKFPDILMQLDE